MYTLSDELSIQQKLEDLINFLIFLEQNKLHLFNTEGYSILYENIHSVVINIKNTATKCLQLFEECYGSCLFYERDHKIFLRFLKIRFKLFSLECFRSSEIFNEQSSVPILTSNNSDHLIIGNTLIATNELLFEEFKKLFSSFKIKSKLEHRNNICKIITEIRKELINLFLTQERLTAWATCKKTISSSLPSSQSTKSTNLRRAIQDPYLQTIIKSPLDALPLYKFKTKKQLKVSNLLFHNFRNSSKEAPYLFYNNLSQEEQFTKEQEFYTNQNNQKVLQWLKDLRSSDIDPLSSEYLSPPVKLKI